ncbi:MAG: S8 family serine peptidase, partial [Phycisphaerales bacterium]|nr:S8 family serine peptidase [Phycisphaerales bacterium]
MGRHCGLGLGIVVMLGVTGAGFGDGYHRSYFDEALPLGLDRERIAVQMPASGDATALDASLAPFGLSTAGAEPLALTGWTLIETTDGVRRSDASIESLVTALVASRSFAFVSPVFLDERMQPLIMTRDLLIGFESGVGPEMAGALLGALVPGAVLDRDFAGLPGVYRVRTTFADGFDVLALANDLASRADVRFAESDAIVRGRLTIIPNDPMFGQLWGLHQASDADMDAPEAWDVTIGDDAIRVVVMDMGIDQAHPDLHQAPGMDFTGNNTPGGGPFSSCDDHGTAVAGCVSATIDNGLGVVGVAPNCTVTSAKIGVATSFFGLCLGFFDSQPSMLMNALDWSASSGARVTNSSFSYTVSAGVTNAYANARANGVVHFAATGNSGEGTIAYPSSLASVNAIGAMAPTGVKASFSQYGTGIAFCAPGQGIASTDRVGSAGYESGDYVSGLDGTSFASPYAAGVAALVLSVDPSLTPAEVEDILDATCVDVGAAGYDLTYGHGFVNAFNAVTAASSTTPCPGDGDGDGTVGPADLAALLGAWGTADPTWDLNASGDVGPDDLAILLGAWG